MEFTNEELLVQANSGSREAVDMIVEKNSGLVWSIVKRFLNRGYEKEDLYQIGCIGLIKAIRKFNSEYNTQFSTYAVPLIMGEIKRFCVMTGWLRLVVLLRKTQQK